MTDHSQLVAVSQHEAYGHMSTDDEQRMTTTKHDETRTRWLEARYLDGNQRCVQMPLYVDLIELKDDRVKTCVQLKATGARTGMLQTNLKSTHM